jgi:hypothetical protein
MEDNGEMKLPGRGVFVKYWIGEEFVSSELGPAQLAYLEKGSADFEG